MCPKRIQLKYIEGCSRYDTQTRDMLTNYLKTGTVPAKFASFGSYYKNICYLNKTRQKATRECCNKFVQNKAQYDVNFVYNGKRKLYTVAEDMPVLVTQI